MKDYFENTTQITEDGYAAILRSKRKRQRLVCRCFSLVLSAPFLGRLIYILVLWISGVGDHVQFHVSDLLVVLSLLCAIWIWRYPDMQIREYIHHKRAKLDLDVVNHYTFFPDHLQMMTTSSSERFDLNYHSLTWVHSSGNWLVLYFAQQNFTMLVDRAGFTRGTADACLAFLRSKLAS